MAKSKAIIDISVALFQEDYKGSTEALPPMRTAPAASVVVKFARRRLPTRTKRKPLWP